MSSADAVRAPSTGIKKSSSCSSLESISSSTKALSQEDIVNLALSLDLNSPSLDAKKPFSSSSKSSGDDSVFIFSGIKKSSSCSSLESMSPSTKALSQEDIVNLALSLNLNSPSLDAKKPFSSSSESSGDDSGTNSESSYSVESRQRDFDFLSPYFPQMKYSVPCSMLDPDQLPTYIPVGVEYHPGMDKSLLLKPGPTCRMYIGPPVFCKECCKEHIPYTDCPYVPVTCNICSKPHRTTDCPYLDYIPQGADFDRDKFEVVCQCGNQFNVDKWVCTFCTGNSALLQRKICDICFCVGHSSHECLKDKVRAAEYKSIIDHELSVERKMIPYEVVLAQRAAERGEPFEIGS